MNFLRKNKISFNNFEQLNILNDLYKIPKIVDNRYKLSSKSKTKTKTILLEKHSPNHFPQYVKLTKRINNDFSKSRDETKTSLTNKNINKSNFDNLSQVRNSLYTNISQNLNRMKNNPIYLAFNRDINRTNFNDFTNSFVNTQEENNEIINSNLKRNNRFIPISPSHIPKKDITANREKSNKNNLNIEVEENNNNKNNDNYYKKHKIRYLLSKNYCGKRLIKRKYLISSPTSIASTFNKKDKNKNISLKNNLQIDINNNNKDIEKTPNDNYRSNNINNSPITLSNITDINQNKKVIRTSLKKFNDNNQIQTTPITTSEVQRNRNNIITEEIGMSEKNINNIFLRNDNNKNEIKINLNDLIFFEERLNDIIISIKNNKNTNDINAINETMEFIYFYCNSSLQNKFPLFFNTENRIIIKSAYNLHLYMIILLHYLSLNSSILIQALTLLRKIFNLLKINLYLIIRKIEIYYGEEFCQNNEIFFKVFNIFLKENDLYDLKEKEIIDIINKNCISITIDIEKILNYIQKVNVKYFLDFKEMYITISKINENDIIDYFYYNLNNNNNNNNKENEKIPQKSDLNINNNKESTDNNNLDNNDNNILIEQNQDNEYLDQIIISYKKNKKIPPFIKLKNKKKYTLVLDLEDTLVNVKIDNDGNIFCHPRPGLISFMNGIKPFYEIISFTKLSKEYSDIIIKEIEGNKKLFDYSLYREHCTLIGREFIKDIGRLGRDMTKIVMVDDVEENLSFYPNNGILISPYNVENDRDDRALLELKKLLISFFRMGYEDIRVAIKNYKKEIYNNITLGTV